VDIDIIIPCFNQIDYTRRTIDSIMKNSSKHHCRFIFVDNGSTDGTSEYLMGILNSTTITNPENMYVNYAWNQGVELADNPFVCILNNDVEVAKDWLDPVEDAFLSREKEWYVPLANYDTCWHNIPCYNELKRYETLDDFYLYKPQHEILYLDRPISGICMFFRTKDVKKVFPIPSCLKIWYGDFYIYRMLKNLDIKLHVLLDSALFHFCSRTVRSSPSLEPLLEEDMKQWKKLRTGLFI
jgi:GT2 family glycosyltransferase